MSELTKEEKEKIDIFIKEQKKIRKIDNKFKNENEIIDIVSERIYFHLTDFIIKNNFHQDRVKLFAIWEYLKKELN